MKKFLLNLSVFVGLFLITGEILIRIFKLTPDIPTRFVDAYGIQRYKPNQSGYIKGSFNKWKVNNEGWVGYHSSIHKDTLISLIGDSYIENMMHPIECNQGYMLEKLLPQYSFYEAARSGVTFIEAMEISKILNIELHPTFQVLYVGKNDFFESISEINRYSDRLQFSVKTQKILKAKLKNQELKSILYNIKILYYLYLKFPIFVEKQNKDQNSIDIPKIDELKIQSVKQLLNYCKKNYNCNNLVLILQPGTDEWIIDAIHKVGIKTCLLYKKNGESWAINNSDPHWTCFGHQQVSKQVCRFLLSVFTSVNGGGSFNK